MPPLAATGYAAAFDACADRAGQTIWVAIEEHGRVVYVNKSLGDRAAPSRGGIGERILLHSASIGRAMLSQFSEERIDEIIDRHGLPKLTDKTITDRETLMTELEEIRERSVAFNDGESLRGLRAVASSVVHAGEIVGAIAISGAANRMKSEYFREELADLVQGAANEIELKMGVLLILSDRNVHSRILSGATDSGSSPNLRSPQFTDVCPTV